MKAEDWPPILGMPSHKPSRGVAPTEYAHPCRRVSFKLAEMGLCTIAQLYNIHRQQMPAFQGDRLPIDSMQYICIYAHFTHAPSRAHFGLSQYMVAEQREMLTELQVDD